MFPAGPFPLSYLLINAVLHADTLQLMIGFHNNHELYTVRRRYIHNNNIEVFFRFFDI